MVIPAIIELVDMAAEAMEFFILMLHEEIVEVLGIGMIAAFDDGADPKGGIVGEDQYRRAGSECFQVIFQPASLLGIKAACGWVVAVQHHEMPALPVKAVVAVGDLQLLHSEGFPV